MLDGHRQFHWIYKKPEDSYKDIAKDIKKGLVLQIMS